MRLTRFCSSALARAALALVPVLLLFFGLARGHGEAEPASPPNRAPLDEPCAGCHAAPTAEPPGLWGFLENRARLDRAARADSLNLERRCGSCHAVPDPGELPPERWTEAVRYMRHVRAYLGALPAHTPTAPAGADDRRAELDVLHYYVQFSRPDAPLPPDPPVSGTPFLPTPLGAPVRAGEPPPRIGNVNVTDLDANGEPDVLVCDFNRGLVTWLARRDGRWQERPLVSVPFPGRTEVADVDGDGRPDLAVAVLGTDVPSDSRNGGVMLLRSDEAGGFTGEPILSGVGRVADVRAGDFDGDGDQDFVVAVFGWLRLGEIGWLEQTDGGAFAYHRISDQAGGVDVAPVDLNADGRLDFVALIAQEHETVTAFLNEGDGAFSPHVLYQAASPTFGASGLALTDLDQDGDTDVLFTNGDAVDLYSSMVRPYHGVQWLENQGGLAFVYHDLLRLYGAYRAVAGDLDGDGDLDVVATSLLNDWADPARQSLVWLENDGRQRFTAHGIAGSPTHVITAALGDLNGDGRLDLVTGSMHFEPPYDRLGRVVLWQNTGL